MAAEALFFVFFGVFAVVEVEVVEVVVVEELLFRFLCARRLFIPLVLHSLLSSSEVIAVNFTGTSISSSLWKVSPPFLILIVLGIILLLLFATPYSIVSFLKCTLLKSPSV
ncbi:ORF1023 [White spot syndrome virus]|uniref:ORF1023 n=1 Tax=White spot syndrome virus TaxID=342409 RepID=A0A2D3I5F0_9VIRU|nr:ORF1023 [White spot syndrome virus]